MKPVTTFLSLAALSIVSIQAHAMSDIFDGDPVCNFQVEHCTGSEATSLVIRAYSQDDPSRIVAIDDKTLSQGSTGDLYCKGESKCYFAVEALGEFGASGYNAINCDSKGYAKVLDNKVFNNTYGISLNSCSDAN